MHSVHPAYDRVRQHSFGDLLREQRRSRPQQIALVDGDVRLTYPELDARVNQLAHVLRALGVEQGSRLLWLGQNSFRVMEALLAAAKIGAVLCPANWRMTAPEIVRTLADFTPTVVFWQESEVGDIVRAARAESDVSTHWLQHDGEGPESYEGLIKAAPDTDEDAEVNADLPWLAIYTAAFDGQPNAALLSHTTLLLQSMLSMQGQQVDENSAYLVSGPMFHVGVLMGTLAAFMAGGRCVFVPRPDAQTMIELIQSERITHAFLAGPTVEQMRVLNKDGRYDVSSMFPTPDMRDWKMPLVMPATAPLMRSPGAYGQTEISGMSILAWLGGSGAGRPAPFIQVRLVDGEGNDVAPETPGEIVVRGPLVMCGYHNRESENTRRTLQGWHRTNDLGLRKPDGSIVFVGPKTTMIKSGIENIYPAEVEGCLRSHPAVQDVCVIGVPDATWDQNVKAVVVVRAGVEAQPEMLIEHCRARIASYKKPKTVVFVEALPRNSAGGIDREAVDAAHGGGNYPKVG
jgi:long-chain acyl-CoA synthetase